MIDTDKYEKTKRWLKEQFTYAEMADEMLLLIAEVKRLRQLIKDIGDSSKGNDEYIQARIKEELE